MHGANGKKKWAVIVASLSLVIFAGVLYVDYKTDQLMDLASGEIIEVLEPHIIDIPVETVSEKATEMPDLSEHDIEGLTPSDGQELSSAEQEKIPAKSPPISASTPSNSETELASENAADISTEEATLFEKAQAYKLASSKLSAKEINALMQWSQDGFTETEKESAKSLFYSRFSEEEQQWILGLFKKYN